jgi:hypothetical protein
VILSPSPQHGASTGSCVPPKLAADAIRRGLLASAQPTNEWIDPPIHPPPGCQPAATAAQRCPHQVSSEPQTAGRGQPHKGAHHVHTSSERRRRIARDQATAASGHTESRSLPSGIGHSRWNDRRVRTGRGRVMTMLPRPPAGEVVLTCLIPQQGRRFSRRDTGSSFLEAPSSCSAQSRASTEAARRSAIGSTPIKRSRPASCAQTGLGDRETFLDPASTRAGSSRRPTTQEASPDSGHAPDVFSDAHNVFRQVG